MKKRQRIKHNRRGTTMVELVVCMALLGIFLVCVSSLTAPVIKTVLRTRDTAQAQSVADAVIQTIRGELGSATGYVKLRDADGKSVSQSAANTSCPTVEFVYPYQDEDLSLEDAFVARIDARGTGDTNETDEKYVVYNHSSNAVAGIEREAADYLGGTSEEYENLLVERFYRQRAEQSGTENRQNLYYDYDKASNTDVVYDLELKYSKASYLGMTLGTTNGEGLSFSIPTDAIEADGTVRYVNVSVTLYRDGVACYTATGSVELRNRPKYNGEATTYFDTVG